MNYKRIATTAADSSVVVADDSLEREKNQIPMKCQYQSQPFSGVCVSAYTCACEKEIHNKQTAEPKKLNASPAVVLVCLFIDIVCNCKITCLSRRRVYYFAWACVDSIVVAGVKKIHLSTKAWRKSSISSVVATTTFVCVRVRARVCFSCRWLTRISAYTIRCAASGKLYAKNQSLWRSLVEHTYRNKVKNGPKYVSFAEKNNDFIWKKFDSFVIEN